MPTRSGGRYRVRNGKPVLEERAGYTPEKELTADTSGSTATTARKDKSATKKEQSDADA